MVQEGRGAFFWKLSTPSWATPWAVWWFTEQVIIDSVAAAQGLWVLETALRGQMSVVHLGLPSSAPELFLAHSFLSFSPVPLAWLVCLMCNFGKLNMVMEPDILFQAVLYAHQLWAGNIIYNTLCQPYKTTFCLQGSGTLTRRNVYGFIWAVCSIVLQQQPVDESSLSPARQLQLSPCVWQAKHQSRLCLISIPGSYCLSRWRL